MKSIAKGEHSTRVLTPFANPSSINCVTSQDIQSVIDSTCAKLGFSSEGITFRFNGRMSSTMGYANYVTKSMDFSSVLWEKATPAERSQVVIHELCHILAGAEGRGHKRVWQMLMLRAGVRPDRCHNVPVIKRKQHGSLEAHCGCRKWVLSTRTANRFRSGVRMFCRKCRKPLVVTEEALKQDVLKHGVTDMARRMAAGN